MGAVFDQRSATETRWDHPHLNLPYMYHCHMLLHDDEGMMGQFVVTERGQEAEVGVPAGHEH